MRIALAQVPHPTEFEAGLHAVLKGVAVAADRGAKVVCFPECCLNGTRGTEFPVEPLTMAQHDQALERVRAAAAAYSIAVVLPTERPHEGVCFNGAYVVGPDGAIQGYQTKNQIPFEEADEFVPGSGRRLFLAAGVPFGVVICHEGWRYPESVRWAAARGARIVFHPVFGGGPRPRVEGGEARPGGFYDQAQACRAAENHVWFASVNFALPDQEAATVVVSPDGDVVASARKHDEQILVTDIDPEAATGYLARRFAPERYGDD